MNEDRLKKQLEFVVEIDKLKTVLRRAYISADPNIRDSSAEHSWHVAMMALVLSEHCQLQIELTRVLKMLLIHDIVEIDAGDIGIYDKKGAIDKVGREKLGAQRIFGLLPHDQYLDLSSLWEEFEKGITPESKFARALDRLIPLLHNYHTQGKRWKEDGITYDQVIAVNQIIEDSSPELWNFALDLINESTQKGYLIRPYLI